MKLKSKLLLVVSHLIFFGIGVGAGIYLLPILVAQENASLADVEQIKNVAKYNGEFEKQKGSNSVHWAKGEVFLTENEIAFSGEVSPGPDYKVYLTKTQADDNESFMAIKDEAVLIGDLKNFGNFTKKIPAYVNIDEYTTVQIWCESFGQFIGSAKYKKQ